MALIKCTECGHDVSDQATSCPSCGAPVMPMLSRPPMTPPREPYPSPTAPGVPQSTAGPASPAKPDPIGQVFGVVGIVLGLAALFMPYFVSVFLVPGAFVCAAVALVRKQQALGIMALLAAAIGLVGVVGTANEIRSILKDPFAPSRVLGTDASPVVTLAEYEQLQEGMSYQQVTDIIGAPGEEMSRSDIAGYSTVMYSWTNEGGSNMNAMFQNDALVTKAQLGLP